MKLTVDLGSDFVRGSDRQNPIWRTIPHSPDILTIVAHGVYDWKDGPICLPCRVLPSVKNITV